MRSLASLSSEASGLQSKSRPCWRSELYIIVMGSLFTLIKKTERVKFLFTLFFFSVRVVLTASEKI